MVIPDLLLLLASLIQLPVVSISDCDRWPQDWRLMDQIVLALEGEREHWLWIAAQEPPLQQQRYVDAAVWSEYRRQAWNAASWAVYTREQRRLSECATWLRQLADLLGPEDYAAGRLPGPVPLPREVISR